jgi:hypothetical protein
MLLFFGYIVINKKRPKKIPFGGFSLPFSFTQSVREEFVAVVPAEPVS